MTENSVSLIEWDTERAKKTLKGLMEKRFTIVLRENDRELLRWDQVFDEEHQMPGRQSKYDHMRDRSYLRPRDIIKFSNCALGRFKERKHTPQGDASLDKIDNVDVHNARIEFSEYFLREIDDEVHKHVPEYERYLDIIRAIGTWQFDKTEFEEQFAKQYANSAVGSATILEQLYDYSLIGFYRAGGRGFGGSEYMFKYREARVRFDPTSTRFRTHPGLIESLGLKRT